VKIVEACEANSQYFIARRNAAGLLGFSPYQKISAAMRVIAYGIPTDYADEFFYDNVGSSVKPTRNPDEIQAFLETYRNTENAETHWQLKNNLLEHHWQRHGGE
jgi:hypothetical protein